jgi:deoxyadenosine/deoxycytidine kinase
MTNPFVIVIAGPTGVGKTTLSKMLSKHFNCTTLSEDDIAKEIFPNVYKDIEDYPDKLKIAENQLLKRTKEIFDSGRDVVIDMINLEGGFVEEIKKTFH